MDGQWLHVATPHQEYWINLADVLYFETPGKAGKPLGWVNEYAAQAVLAGGAEPVALTPDQWRQAKQIMGWE
jgi:hypothetical protein